MARQLVALSACLLMLAGGGCRSSGDDRPTRYEAADVREVVTRHYTGLRDLDAAMVCHTLTETARRLLGLAAPRQLAIGGRLERLVTCEIGLDQSFRRSGRRKNELALPRVPAVKIDGRRAKARVIAVDRSPTTVRLVEVGGEWRFGTVEPVPGSG